MQESVWIGKLFTGVDKWKSRLYNGYTNVVIPIQGGINHRTKTKCKRYCNKLFFKRNKGWKLNVRR